jgi:hypothetical protein
MAQERRINLRFPPDRFDQLDEKRFQARTTFQEIGARLFEEWLTGKHPEPKLLAAPKLDPFLEKVEMIRASGDAELLAIVKRAVDVTYGLLQHSLTPEEIGQLRAAANSHTGLAVRHRRTGVAGEEPAGEGGKGTRKSA